MTQQPDNPISDAFEKQAEQSDRSWKARLLAGKRQAGNLAVNLTFLAQSGLLTRDQKILEVGCGVGTLVHELTKKGFSVIGTDISRQAIEFGKKEFPDLHLEVQPAQHLKYPDNAFDRVLSFDVFEHIQQIDQHLEEVHRVLRPGGYYLFQTPNKYSNILFETLKSRSLGWRKYHPSLHSTRQLHRRLTRHGFTADFVKMNTINEFSLQKLERLHIPPRLVSWIDTRWLPLWLQTNLYVIAQKPRRESAGET